ncbi:CPBP family intramembrane glutamic endopeptidase [Bacillus pseudomycoides]|uniref:CPBP family intramembrane metalloprotease n=1 Tax=Bacillus pseudomycoides TaxID=64104 RepID=A0A2B5HFS4_9BACI|nr:CPBP family intramembrane glutamic endopeptidase [Bacillus pseudomycoides]PEA80924.1 CPBP family intramembrane metalloprotease [Bacillus pseudomycoides]PED05542.1 CPBP family intramembrane metalloprotease [Bacillus pseudomycoides]PED71541.1 CPBP family intramembrane metalloprotease [Bacillus pseudomycoides]PEI47169.1 CPBP family intramembrane metalloprotease [Bacillus pseudomycoides]PEI96900.1 CPBP family intramembrane metalloprotease [Bacillus pseudomycoides]
MIILTMLFLYLILGEGILGKRWYNKLQEDIQRNQNARVLFYMRTMSVMWGLTAIMLVTSYFIDIPFEEYGLKLPYIDSMSINHLEKENISMLVGACIGIIISFVAIKKSKVFQRHTEKQMSSFSEMLPTNYRESILWILICITAGITEELLFRSFMMNYLSQLFPWLSTTGVLIISSIIFGLAHIYQGWKGVVGTMILGFLFGRLYVTTGSVYPSMLLHIIIDLLVIVRLFVLKGKVILQRA